MNEQASFALNYRTKQHKSDFIILIVHTSIVRSQTNEGRGRSGKLDLDTGISNTDITLTVEGQNDLINPLSGFQITLKEARPGRGFRWLPRCGIGISLLPVPYKWRLSFLELTYTKFCRLSYLTLML